MLTPCLESCFICSSYHLSAYLSISTACRVWQAAAVGAPSWKQAAVTEFISSATSSVAQSHLLEEKTRKSLKTKVLICYLPAHNPWFAQIPLFLAPLVT